MGGAFEFLLSEWHITPDYIVNNWTDELLALMVDKLSERKQREIDAMKGSSTPNRYAGKEVISDTELFARMGIKVKKVKKDGD